MLSSKIDEIAQAVFQKPLISKKRRNIELRSVTVSPSSIGVTQDKNVTAIGHYSYGMNNPPQQNNFCCGASLSREAEHNRLATMG
jgi:hypothetical protein